MPAYDYRCQYCGNTIEIQLSLAEVLDRIIVACTGCDHNMKRLYTTPPAIHFRGSGFYCKGG